MFCSQCGTPAIVDALFCSKCGRSLRVGERLPAQRIENLPEEPQSPRLTFGVPATRGWFKFTYKTTFSDGYAWIQNRNTLLICEHHLVLLQGAEKRSGAMDIIGAAGLVGGVIKFARDIKDYRANRQFELSEEIAAQLFEERKMLWCKKSDAVIWQYHEKPLFLIIPTSSEQLYCKFNSMAGVIHASCELWTPKISQGGPKPDFKDLGCTFIVEGRGLSERDSYQAMAISRERLPSLSPPE